MATIDKIEQELTKADVRLDEATKNLENFMKEENLEKFEKRWGTEAMKEEKKRLVESKGRWEVLYQELLRGGEGNEQIA